MNAPERTGRWHAHRAARRRREALRIAILIVVVTIAWCALYKRVTPAAWQTPVGYADDALITLTVITVGAGSTKAVAARRPAC